MQGGKLKTDTHALPRSILASTGLGMTVAHAFPHLPPDAPRSVASLLAGKQITVASTVLPTPAVMAHVAQGFGRNMVAAKATFLGLPSRKMAPVTEITVTRRVALRHSVFIGANTGSVTWHQNLWDLFHLPEFGTRRNGLVTMGYNYHPISAEFEQGDTDPRKPNEFPRTTSPSQRSETYTLAVATGVMASGGQLTLGWGRTFFVGTPITAQSLQQTRRQNVGIRLKVEAKIGFTASQCDIKATRKIFENTTMGLSFKVSNVAGVAVGVSWERLGQRFNIPIILSPVPDIAFITWGLTVPIASYIAAELLWLRPRERKLRLKQSERVRRLTRAKIERRRQAAQDAQAVMRPVVERRQAAEAAEGGLVIRKATYGTRDGKVVADVTIAVAALVDGAQLVVPKNVVKRHILGFWDPAPGDEKVLIVRYVFDGKLHEAVVGEKQPLVAPKRSHLLGRE